MNGDAPEKEPEEDEHAHVEHVLPALEAEDGVADERDAVVQRVELRERAGPLRELIQREERAGKQERAASGPR